MDMTTDSYTASNQFTLFINNFSSLLNSVLTVSNAFSNAMGHQSQTPHDDNMNANLSAESPGGVDDYTLTRMRSELVTKWPLVAYLLTALFCLGLSTSCHLCYVRNEQVSKFVTHMDHLGIALLFLGTCYPIISYKYACGPFIIWRYIFTSIISTLTLLCMWICI